jgi:hypothetical protein
MRPANHPDWQTVAKPANAEPFRNMQTIEDGRLHTPSIF